MHCQLQRSESALLGSVSKYPRCCFFHHSFSRSGQPRQHHSASRVQGSGYLTACFAHAVMPGGFVLGIEKHGDLVQRSQRSLQRCIPAWLSDRSVQVRNGNILGGAQPVSRFLEPWCCKRVAHRSKVRLVHALLAALFWAA